MRQGAQVDLLFDRDDGVINLCEIKYAPGPFRLTKDYARDLQDKIAIFEKITKTSKQIVLTLVTTHGLEENVWSRDLIERVVTSDAFL
ncbi:MAG: ATPase [Gammaproteobacteria bacterium]|nr:ATPase [Gammaproteobacteria bacterium]